MDHDVPNSLRVAIEDLRRSSGSPAEVLSTAADVEARTSHLGQERAIDALRFGTRVGQFGYNIFVLGPPGFNRHGLSEEFAQAEAQQRAPSRDWCYVNNFTDAERPRTLSFEAGGGTAFRDDMRSLIDELRLSIPAAFESQDYRNQIKAIESEAQEKIEGYWRELEKRAAEDNIGVLQTPTGFVLAPMRQGKVLSDKEFEQLPDDERKSAQAAIKRLSEELETRIEAMPRLQKQVRERIKELNQRITERSVGILLADLRRRYSDQPEVVQYLDAIERDIIEHADEFRGEEHTSLPFLRRDTGRLFNQYEVNLIVDNRGNTAAPVVYEPNPSYQNIIGKIEHRAEMGALLTDFRMIRGGALHRANGGFLILDMHRVLTRPFVWEALKQALTARRIRIESPGETYGLISTTTLQPEPIPLDVKVLLIGERRLYYLLCEYDPEFQNLFKVAADLNDDLVRSDDNVSAYVKLVATRIGMHELLNFDAQAIDRVVEERARIIEDSERLSMHMRSLDDLLVQSDYWARQRGSDAVAAADVAKAIDEKRRRLGRIQSRIADAIARDTLLIDTSGERVGQINGLSVTDLGEFSFGHPVRITATTRLGTGDVVDIEREIELGGAIHSKGVLILSAALSARYASDAPFSLQACIVFEQTYGGVEGDSASVAEYCALLSSLADTPIRQNLAVTGSVNQLGRVQVVGGVNEKIEGFFDICRDRGLDGTHGVVIPRDNVKHLMLRPDVVDAVRDNKFSVFAVRTVDEALTILTGKPAGERGEDGEFPPDTVNRLVEERLQHYAEVRKKSSTDEDDGDGSN